MALLFCFEIDDDRVGRGSADVSLLVPGLDPALPDLLHRRAQRQETPHHVLHFDAAVLHSRLSLTHLHETPKKWRVEGEEEAYCLQEQHEGHALKELADAEEQFQLHDGSFAASAAGFEVSELVTRPERYK